MENQKQDECTSCDTAKQLISNPVHDDVIRRKYYNDQSANNPLSKTIDITSVIYRFKFVEPFVDELYNFSKIHQYEDRITFKESWTQWTNDNSTLVDVETRRLLCLGYDGNVMDKMYKSARYYFRNKKTEKKEPKKRRKYSSVNKDLLDAMDEHILENIKKDDYQPKTGFVDFCKNGKNKDVLKATVHKLCEEEGTKDPVSIEQKMKKTYKNRYFYLITK